MKPLTCAHINSIGLSSQSRTGVLNTSCPCKLAIFFCFINYWGQVITILKQKIRCAQILVRKKLFSKTILHNTTFLFLLLIPKKYYIFSLSIILNMIILQPVSSSESSSQKSMIIGSMTLHNTTFLFLLLIPKKYYMKKRKKKKPSSL
jgi:hypothetical protein